MRWNFKPSKSYNSRIRVTSSCQFVYFFILFTVTVIIIFQPWEYNIELQYCAKQDIVHRYHSANFIAQMTRATCPRSLRLIFHIFCAFQLIHQISVDLYWSRHKYSFANASSVCVSLCQCAFMNLWGKPFSIRERLQRLHMPNNIEVTIVLCVYTIITKMGNTFNNVEFESLVAFFFY